MTKDPEKTPEPSPVERKQYEKPTLEKLGKVTDLTQGVVGAGADAAVLGSQ